MTTSDNNRPQGWKAFLERELKELVAISSDRKETIHTEILEGSRPGARYYILMTIATLIAALGLVTNSPAVIIGAMLISPLMTPIFGVALGLVRGNGKLVRIALVTEFAGVALAIVAGYIIGQLPLYFSVTPEMLARTQPTLLDLGVATLAGLAGCLAMVDERISPVLPGIAIATALVPPLAASGLCFALGAYSGGMGAFLLFFANFLAILIVSGIVFILAGFVMIRERVSGWVLARRFLSPGVSLIVVTVLLTQTLLGSVRDERTIRIIESTMREELADEPSTTLRDVQFRWDNKRIDILANVRAPNPLRPRLVNEIEELIAGQLGTNVRLIVRSLIAKDVSATGSTSAVVDEDLDGKFITTDLNPRVRRLQLAEQALRETLEPYEAVYLRDIDLLDLEGVPVVIANIETTQPLIASDVAMLEDAIDERLENEQVRLVVRSEDIVGVTRKGRILYGLAHLAPMTPEEEESQRQVEQFVRDAIYALPNLHPLNVDAYFAEETWRVRAEVVGPKPIDPSGVKQIESDLSGQVGSSASLEIWFRSEVIVDGDGYAPLQGYSESQADPDAEES